jgi:TIR domain
VGGPNTVTDIMEHSPKIFISYRRDDTGGDAGWLNDTLNQLLGSGSTFFDVSSIVPGRDFEVELKRALSQTRFLLALIGPKWEMIENSVHKPRLYDEDDYVRMELLAAIENNVHIVPILLNRNSVPNATDLPDVLGPITKLEAFEIRRDRWIDDVSALLKKLDIALDPDEDRQARQVSAMAEWKRGDHPDPTPRRWVVYIDNHSEGPIIVKEVRVISKSLELSIDDWGAVAPKASSDYELEEQDFNPVEDRPNLYVRFVDAHGRKWSLRNAGLRRLRR